MKNIVLITQVGIGLVVSIVIGAYLGSLIDGWLGTKWIFSIILLLMGVVSGCLNAYNLIMILNKEEKGKDKSE